MTKALLVVLLLAVLPTLPPDEGQWLPQQFLAKDWTELKARGLELSKDEFWHPERGGVLSAAVQINGCSASFVSSDGLVVTNHHCGFGAIQELSSLEDNLVENGFVAPTREAERPAPGVVVFVLRRIEDVTEAVKAKIAAATTDLDRHFAERDAIAAIVQDAEAREPNVRCSISSYFNGRQYLLFVRTMIQDVRLVYAPPRSVGEFGGEVDNWEWPRHTGDFAFFRAYVSPEGRSAPYSKDNVPYRPEHFLKVAKQGVREGDLVMIMGYPGRTERYLTSAAVASREANLFPLRHRVLTDVLLAIDAVTEGDPGRELALSSTRKSLANVQKNALGMVRGLARNGVVAKKLREEAAFSAWVAEDQERTQRFGAILPELMELDRLDARFESHDELLNQVFRNAPFFGQMVQLCLAAREKEKPDAERLRDFRQADLRRLERSFLGMELQAKDLEERVLAIVFREALGLPHDTPLGTLKEMVGEVVPAEFAALLYGESPLFDRQSRRALYEGGWKAIQASTDPFVRAARGLAEDLAVTRIRKRTSEGRRLALGQSWITAQEAWRGAAFYPDANSTLRVSVATVKGYSPRDGSWSLPRTRLKGVLEKETGADPFASPESLKAAAATAKNSRFFDPELGDVPVCFLSDGDTTGGNSGSPIVNGRGELVGLNFDRVFENVAGDYGWNADRSRNVSVDVRYVLWNLESVLPAKALLQELGF